MGAAITGKLASGPSGSGGNPLRGAGYDSSLRALLSRVSARRSRDEVRSPLVRLGAAAPPRWQGSGEATRPAQ